VPDERRNVAICRRNRILECFLLCIAIYMKALECRAKGVKGLAILLDYDRELQTETQWLRLFLCFHSRCCPRCDSACQCWLLAENCTPLGEWSIASKG